MKEMSKDGLSSVMNAKSAANPNVLFKHPWKLFGPHPFEKILWDIVGPLPVTPRGKQYMLIVIDLFTKLVEAFPLIDATATTLATSFLA